MSADVHKHRNSDFVEADENQENLYVMIQDETLQQAAVECDQAFCLYSTK